TVTSWLTATPVTPPLRAVMAAPTVPEWYTARPTLAPGLMPDTTRSNGGPNAPSRENITHRAGGPETVHTSSRPSRLTRWISGRMTLSAPTAQPAPLNSTLGAATTTSPNGRMASARTCRPTESMPSSFVTRILIRQRSLPRAAHALDAVDEVALQVR